MNEYLEEWLLQTGMLPETITGSNQYSEPSVSEFNHKKAIGSASVRAAILIATIDGPLPVGDAVAAGILAATGAYLLLS